MRQVSRVVLAATLTAIAGAACQQAEDGAPPARSGEVVSHDGVPIYYTVAGSGPTSIVLVHCWSCDADYWQAQIPELARDHTVVALDLAGHGRSGTGRSEWTIAAFAGDVEAVVAALDLDRVVLVGHSMGGAIVVEAALRMPERVIGLIGIDNFQSIDTHYTDEQIAGFMAPFRDDFRQMTTVLVRTMFPATADSALVSAIATDLAGAPPEIAVPTLEAAVRWSSSEAPAAFAVLAAHGVPLRCISSDRHPTDVEAARRHVPDFDVTLMPGVGHFPMRERPAEFTRLLRETVTAMEGAARARAGSAR